MTYDWLDPYLVFAAEPTEVALRGKQQGIDPARLTWAADAATVDAAPQKCQLWFLESFWFDFDPNIRELVLAAAQARWPDPISSMTLGIYQLPHLIRTDV
jgi:hypothetical protein